MSGEGPEKKYGIAERFRTSILNYFPNHDVDYLIEMLEKRPDEPYYQTSEILGFIPKMDSSGCNFMSELYGVQKDTEVNFSAMEIQYLVDFLMNTDNPSPNAKEGEKCLLPNMTLKNPDVLINKANEMVGKNKTGTVGWGAEENQKASWTIIYGTTEKGNPHYKYGDSSGNVIWDPYGSDLKIDDVDFHEVFLHRR